MSAAFFSQDYAEARRRFVDALQQCGGTHESFPVYQDVDDVLTLDVGCVGPRDAPAIVISSGVHGVEGFLGSALQLALLTHLARETDHQGTGNQASFGAGDVRYVLIHAVNPYGFAHIRRFNEDSVDLNRNFLNSLEDYSGACAAYAEFNDFLNPKSPPHAYEPFLLKALWLIARHGLPALKQAVARGQYEYPQGIFFGGKQPCHSTRIIRDHCDDWLAESPELIHFDVHSGLGSFGVYKLLFNEADNGASADWYARAFGASTVQALADPGGVAYSVSGLFCDWMQNHFSPRPCYSVGMECGTYNVIRVLASVRAENRGFHHADERDRGYRKAKEELLECFCPRSPLWRQRVIDDGLAIIRRGVAALVASKQAATPVHVG